jgi:hypothetical protein
MDEQRILDEQWSYVLSLLPADLEDTARETGALVRKREVKSASDLLRLAMAYGLCGRSLRGTSAWSKFTQTAAVSDVALLKRLKRCGDWLSLLVSQKLAERVSFPEVGQSNLRLRIVDATCICRPGSKGSDWRLHISFDLATMSIDEAHLTRFDEGETLRNFEVRLGDIFLGDRIYGERKGIRRVVSSGGDVLVRIGWQNLPLLKLNGVPFDILKHARRLKYKQAGDWRVKTAPTSKGEDDSVDGRVVILRKSPEAAEEERKKLVKEYKKKGKTPDDRTIEAAGYIFIFTTLKRDDFSAWDVLELYRFRWQIEIEFKRLKSNLEMDEMNARCDELCRTFLLTKLLSALLVEDLARRLDIFSPWGWGRPASDIAGQGVWCSG